MNRTNLPSFLRVAHGSSGADDCADAGADLEDPGRFEITDNRIQVLSIFVREHALIQRFRYLPGPFRLEGCYNLAKETAESRGGRLGDARTAVGSICWKEGENGDTSFF